MSVSHDLVVLAGRPFPQGAFADAEGTSFSVWSEGAERGELCLFDEGNVEGVGPGQRCGYQQRDLLATMTLSQGVPMLLGGDEAGRTQGVSNNVWCQDDEFSWHGWEGGDGRENEDGGDSFLELFNAHHEGVELTIDPERGDAWQIEPASDGETGAAEATTILPARSLRILRSQSDKDPS